MVEAEDEEEVIGHTISHHKILEKLGEGGMGVVYSSSNQIAGQYLPAFLFSIN